MGPPAPRAAFKGVANNYQSPTRPTRYIPVSTGALSNFGFELGIRDDGMGDSGNWEASPATTAQPGGERREGLPGLRAWWRVGGG